MNAACSFCLAKLLSYTEYTRKRVVPQQILYTDVLNHWKNNQMPIITLRAVETRRYELLEYILTKMCAFYVRTSFHAYHVW